MNIEPSYTKHQIPVFQFVWFYMLLLQFLSSVWISTLPTKMQFLRWFALSKGPILSFFVNFLHTLTYVLLQRCPDINFTHYIPNSGTRLHRQVILCRGGGRILHRSISTSSDIKKKYCSNRPQLKCTSCVYKSSGWTSKDKTILREDIFVFSLRKYKKLFTLQITAFSLFCAILVGHSGNYYGQRCKAEKKKAVKCTTEAWYPQFKLGPRCKLTKLRYRRHFYPPTAPAHNFSTAYQLSCLST